MTKKKTIKKFVEIVNYVSTWTGCKQALILKAFADQYEGDNSQRVCLELKISIEVEREIQE